DGIDADGGSGPSGNGYSGVFSQGDVNVNANLLVAGVIVAGIKDFRIDHPLDPANKYLQHASVESSEMMNIYTGNVTLDGSGAASVDLPAWFEALNGDYRYQLTAIGAAAPNLHIAQEVANHQFSGALGCSRHESLVASYRRSTRCFRPGEPVGRGSGKASQRARLLYQSCALWATGRKTDRVGPVSGQDAAAQTEACRAEQSGVSQEVGKPAVRRSSVGSRSRSERLRVRV